MASAHAAVYALLAGDATLAAIVGTRIYVARAPQDAALPYVVYEEAEAERVRSLSGDVDYVSSVVDVSAFAASHAQALAAGNAAREAVNDYRGTSGSTVVALLAVTREQDLHIPPSNGGETGTFERALELEIHWRDA